MHFNIQDVATHHLSLTMGYSVIVPHPAIRLHIKCNQTHCDLQYYSNINFVVVHNSLQRCTYIPTLTTVISLKQLTALA